MGKRHMLFRMWTARGKQRVSLNGLLLMNGFGVLGLHAAYSCTAIVVILTSVVYTG